MGNTIRIITCSVFKPALEHLQIEARYPDLRVTCLHPSLHTQPLKLRRRVMNQIAAARRRNERPVCLYGECFPDMDIICRWRGVAKVPGPHCYEMLLGGERFNRLVEEVAGTFFLERELILGFEKYCNIPLELYDEEMRQCYFEHYRRLLYVRQPSDPDLVSKASELAGFLKLSLDVADADYSDLEQRLVAAIRL